MDDRDKEIDNKIAENEAKRAIVSQVRVSTWAVLAAIAIALICVLLYLTR
ncbi:MAG: hypothetical protein K2X60_01785 [Xanthobacteraceae bacterium]|nr:hypothetical protein [Xanthobacteraceae bacterium]